MSEVSPADLLQRALDAVPQPLVVAESDHGTAEPRVRHVNAAFEAVAGGVAAELPVAYNELLERTGLAEPGPEALRRARATGEIREGRGRMPNGENRWWRVTPLAEGNGRPTTLVVLHAAGPRAAGPGGWAARLEELTRLQREVADSGLSLDRIRQRVAEAALFLTGADGASVAEPADGHLVDRATAGSARLWPDLQLPIDRGVSGSTYRRREPILVRDARTDERVVLKDTAERLGFRSAALAPLVHQDRCFGLVKVLANEPDRFDTSDLELLTIAAGMLASPLANAAAFEGERARHTRLLDALPVLVAYVDSSRRYREVNAAYRAWYGLEQADVIGRPVWDVIGPEAYESLRPYHDAVLRGEQVSYEGPFTFGDGSQGVIHADYVPHRTPEGAVVGFYAIVLDVTKVSQADRDYLTGLPNRRRFDEQLHAALVAAHRYERPLGLILADLDGFKQINDTHGHPRGDEVLRSLSASWRGAIRASDVIARWGGEEFVVLAPETSEEETARLAERLRALTREIDLGDDLAAAASFGVTACTPADDARSLMQRLDGALYRAKRAGGDRVLVERG